MSEVLYTYVEYISQLGSSLVADSLGVGTYIEVLISV